MEASTQSIAADSISDLCLRDEILGAGGWSVVYKGDFCGHEVAVKTFNSQVRRDVEERVQRHRFLKEVKALKALGQREIQLSQPDMTDAQKFIVNLLAYSNSGGVPGPAPNGHFYTILELGHSRLDQWLRRPRSDQTARRTDSHQMWHFDFCDIARSVFAALHCLHVRGLVHLDVKPQNIMRFGHQWKLIDLESCMSLADGSVSIADITPLYASPELAQAVLCRADPTATGLVPPHPTMDIWAAGVVLLDVLAEGCCFDEMKASLDLAALFEEEAVLNEGWFRWLSSSEPLDLHSLFAATPGACKLDHQLELFLDPILTKEPGLRASALQLRDHQFLNVHRQGRHQVEKVFSSLQAEDAETKRILCCRLTCLWMYWSTLVWRRRMPTLFWMQCVTKWATTLLHLHLFSTFCIWHKA
ncbi:unnamed protein product [Durusdinium trenchii]|uniref:Protein kinase domain-containing protein n=1 Tax=Durusdinium trenchii TaxID=1381693 RepID=A0ABP0ST56_9DINO